MFFVRFDDSLKQLICVWSSADAGASPERMRARGSGADLLARGASARPKAGSGGPAGCPPGGPAVLGRLLGSAAGDALSEDRRHGSRLLGPDGVPEVVGQGETLGTVLGPGPGLLGPLPGLCPVQEPRSGQEAHNLNALTNQ